MSSDPLWYKDAIIYQLHVKCFKDSNNDGIGDFRGLIEKLDYIQDLGVTAIWLLPFYPSPLKDDGYDIAEFTGVHPDYGTMRDAKTFIRSAHQRGLRVITELVVNHTSDQHTWFQAARRAPPGSAKREFYVWSDTDQRFPETRIIFTDTETSNWTWDPVAQAYYWHRFFSHQPDLNHNNPEVARAVMRVMRLWLDAGVDGLRLDAIPYLCVREGTNNENLPETHEVLKQFRALIDAEYPDRMLLAEANQWPEDVRPYFGDGDECHMAFHFPVMPRIFLAVALEDPQPIIEIMSQTPEIPDSCQWAIFLRNHDELTLEMVTERERRAMFEAYAADPKMRRNVGICRRLAPLMDSDRRKVELLFSLLLSFPGTPVIYYGDELGMGDNIYLNDRDGVRTPMQWSADRNAGFSRVDPAQLYLPVLMDPVYGYQAVNVEALSRCPSSLLNWIKQIIAVRKEYAAFGRGSMRFLHPRNPKILAYLREHGAETLLCVTNLSRSPQPVELELGQFNGRTPVELMGRTPFPRIDERPYPLTLAGYGSYWFLLAEEGTQFEELQAPPRPPFWVIPDGWPSMIDDQRKLQEIIAPFLLHQRWFGGKGQTIESLALTHELLPDHTPGSGWLLCLVHVNVSSQERQSYFLPLALTWDDDAEEFARRHPHCILAKVRQSSRVGVLHDAFYDPEFSKTLIKAIGENRVLPLGSGQLSFNATTFFPVQEMLDPQEARTLSAEQSNTLVVLDDQLILKGYRLLTEGPSPELEIGRYLTEVARFENTPPVVGALEYHQAEGATMTIALLQVYLPNQGDGWSTTIDQLEQYLTAQRVRSRSAKAGDAQAGAQEPAPDELLTSYLTLMFTLGLRTGQLHTALARKTGDPAFDPEPITSQDLNLWRELILKNVGRTCDALADQLPRLDAPTRQQAEQFMAIRLELEGRIKETSLATGGLKTRFHGDLHLGQILVTQQDIQIIDFEGERPRPGQPRRQKHSPLRDLAGIMRSLSYAADTVLRRVAAVHPEDTPTLERWAKGWEERATSAFLDGCREGAQSCPAYPGDPAATRDLLHLFVIEKALYEINYELSHRPEWAGIPLRGILTLFDELRTTS